MLAHGCGAADARLTASARSGLQVAGRDAGTGAPTEHRNCQGKPGLGGGNSDDLIAAAVFTRFLAAIYTSDEAVHLRALNTAGVGEEAFHQAIQALRAAPGLSDESVITIAKAYIGDGIPLADRDAALGAIETRFYEGRRTTDQARGNAVK
jgi:hypothetical protein